VVQRSAVVRRAKLYFLRDRVGKAVRLKERRVERTTEAKAKPKRRARRKKKEVEKPEEQD
jgi:large subunit ribosomal protein L19